MNPKYQLYHPKWRRPRTPIFWWLGKFAYTKFISRELTSLAVAYCAVALVIQIVALSLGEGPYERFFRILQLKPVLLFHLFVLLVLLFHTVTWLNLAPRALVLHLGRHRIPDGIVVAAHYLGWLAATGLVAWVLLGR